MRNVAKHPARYSPELLPVLADTLAGTVGVVLDPFAGTGERLAELAAMLPTARFVGIELQQKWQLCKVLPFRSGGAS